MSLPRNGAARRFLVLRNVGLLWKLAALGVFLALAIKVVEGGGL